MALLVPSGGSQVTMATCMGFSRGHTSNHTEELQSVSSGGSEMSAAGEGGREVPSSLHPSLAVTQLVYTAWDT